ncbi:MAG: hypothetical protein IPL77_17520 [Flavobacteriales bacterium]|nr:hypothetical protein [Flavobacteriales bacterium]MBK9538149.1 hypothetical protein [Flavobacteriales bacterium]
MPEVHDPPLDQPMVTVQASFAPPGAIFGQSGPMIARLLFLLLLVSLPSLKGTACSCFGPPTFCGTLDPPYPNPEWWIPDVVVLGVKVGVLAHGMDVRILQSFSGPPQVDDTIRVWGDTGLLCRMYADTWEVGDTVIWGFRITDQLGGPLEQPDDYLISVCGTYWLDYSAGIVSGPIITENGETMTLAEFETLVNGCLSTGIQEAGPGDELTVRYEGGIPVISMSDVQGLAQLSVWDASGRCVRRRGWDGMPMPIEALGSGAYLVRVERELRQAQRKVIVP